MKLPQIPTIEYKPVMIEDIYSQDLEGELIEITGVPKREVMQGIKENYTDQPVTRNKETLMTKIKKEIQKCKGWAKKTTPKDLAPTSFYRLNHFKGLLYQGTDAIRLEAKVEPFNRGKFLFNLAVAWNCEEITIKGKVKRCEDKPNEYVIIPHYAGGTNKNGKEVYTSFFPAPLTVDEVRGMLNYK